MISKACARCKNIKLLDEFSMNKNAGDGLQDRCKPCCMDAYRAIARSKNPNYVGGPPRRPREKCVAATTSQARNRLRKYGMTACAFTLLRIAQNDRCAICRTPSSERRLVIDHDHDTGKVRGLLCDYCNTGVGFLENLGGDTVVNYLVSSSH